MLRFGDEDYGIKDIFRRKQCYIDTMSFPSLMLYSFLFMPELNVLNFVIKYFSLFFSRYSVSHFSLALECLLSYFLGCDLKC